MTTEAAAYERMTRLRRGLCPLRGDARKRSARVAHDARQGRRERHRDEHRLQARPMTLPQAVV
jgi:hypothetical protein